MMELFENFKVKNESQSKSIVFKPYQPLIDSESKINEIVNDMKNEKYVEAINKATILIKITLEGDNYILHYDRLYLKIVVVLGYILWILYIFIFIEMKNGDNLGKLLFYNSKEKPIITIISGFITSNLYTYLYIRLNPFNYYLYTSFPCYFFWRICANIKYLKSFFIKYDNINSNIKNICYYIFGFLSFLSLVSI